FHFSNNAGQLLLDNVYVKGVRWDPIVSRSTFLEVAEVVSSTEIKTTYSTGILDIQAGDYVHFWAGDAPIIREITAVVSLGTQNDKLTLSDPLPAEVVVGTRLTLPKYEWDQAIIRNTTVEGNFGTSIVFTNKNLLVEDSVFRNNAYSNIGLGPTSVNTGPFARNVVIRSNVFEDSTWVRKYNNYLGTITSFEIILPLLMKRIMRILRLKIMCLIM